MTNGMLILLGLNTTQKDTELRQLGHINRDGVARQIFSG